MKWEIKDFKTLLDWRYWGAIMLVPTVIIGYGYRVLWNWLKKELREL